MQPSASTNQGSRSDFGRTNKPPEITSMLPSDSSNHQSLAQYVPLLPELNRHRQVAPSLARTGSVCLHSSSKSDSQTTMLQEDSDVDVECETSPQTDEVSSVFQYFSEVQIVQRGTPEKKFKDEIGIYHCLHCEHRYRITGRKSSNLHKHRRECSGLPEAWATHAPGAIPPGSHPRFKTLRKIDLVDELVKCMILQNMPLSSFDSEQIQGVLRQIAPDFEFPRRKMVAKKLDEIYESQKKLLFHELKKVPGRLATATDIWTSRDMQNSYVAVTVQFFNKDGDFCRRLLDFHVLKGRHTGHLLAELFWKTFDEPQINHKVFSITADNATNNTSMVNCLVKKFGSINLSWNANSNLHPCAAHVINLVAQEFLNGMKQLSLDDIEYFNNRAAHIENIGLDLHDDGTDDVFNCYPAHSLDSVSIDQAYMGIFDISPSKPQNLTPETQSRINELAISNGMGVVAAVRQVVGTIRQSPQSRQNFEDCCIRCNLAPRFPKQFPLHRWNYMYAQTVSVLELEKPIKLFLLELRNPKMSLVPQQWEALHFIRPILECFNKFTMILQSDEPRKHMTLVVYHAISSVLKQAEFQITSHSDDDNHIRWDLNTSTQEAETWSWSNACLKANEKLRKYINKEIKNDQTLVAAMLDPAYRQNIFAACKFGEDVTDRAKKALQNAYEEQKNYNICHVSCKPLQPPEQLNHSQHLGAIAEAYGALEPIMAPLPLPDSLDSAFDEIKSYLMGHNPMEPKETIIGYWKRVSGTYPILSQVAFAHLAIPVSSASVERVFSKAGKIAVPTRGRLSPQTICKLVLASHWVQSGGSTQIFR